MAENEVKKKNSNVWYLAWALILVGALVASTQAMKPKEPVFEWKRVSMDGHRTGRQNVTLENVDEALGVFDDEGYVAPNGVRFAEDSPVPTVAQVMMDAQTKLAPLKVVVGHSASMLMDDRDNPDLPLGNMVADAMRSFGAKHFKMPMDFAIINFGGIRTPLPEGAVTLEDINAMFPFKNYICLVKMKGSALTQLFEQLAGTKAFQATSGAKILVKDHKLVSAEVGGKPIDPNKVYNITSLDFLLDGGDGIRLGALADKVTLTHVLLKDVILDYVTSCEKAGIVLDGKSDGRVIMED